MERDERLEAISEKIRMGEAVGFFEAFEAIVYQEAWKQFRAENSLLARIKRWLKRAK